MKNYPHLDDEYITPDEKRLIENKLKELETKREINDTILEIHLLLFVLVIIYPIIHSFILFKQLGILSERSEQLLQEHVQELQKRTQP